MYIVFEVKEMIGRDTYLEVQNHYVPQPRFPAIDFHAHFGKLFGAVVHREDYFELYDTKEIASIPC